MLRAQITRALLRWSVTNGGRLIGDSASRNLVFASFRFPPEVTSVTLRWYPRYSLSYRDVGELLVEPGITVDHVTSACLHAQDAAEISTGKAYPDPIGKWLTRRLSRVWISRWAALWRPNYATTAGSWLGMAWTSCSPRPRRRSLRWCGPDACQADR